MAASTTGLYAPETTETEDDQKKPVLFGAIPAPYDPNKPPTSLTPPSPFPAPAQGGTMPFPTASATDLAVGPVTPPQSAPEIPAPFAPSATPTGGIPPNQPGTDQIQSGTPPISQPGGTPSVPMPPPAPGVTWVPNQAGTMWVPSTHPTANTTWQPPTGQAIPQNTSNTATDLPQPTQGVPPNQPAPNQPKPIDPPNQLQADLENFLRRRLDPTGTGRPAGVDRNSAEFRSVADPYAAAIERQQREYLSEAAERNSTRGLGESGAMDLERRMAAERAGQSIGTFEADLARQELQQQRDEIQDALTKLGSQLSDTQRLDLEKQKANLDAALKREGYALTEREGAAGREVQKYTSDLSALLTREGRTFEGGENEKQRTLQTKLAELSAATQEKGFKLQKELGDLQALLTREGRTFEGGENEKNRLLEQSLAALDAAIKRESLAQTGQLGSQDLALREKLGMGGLNVDLFRALLGDVQFNKDLAGRLGISEAELELRLRELLMR